MEENISQKEKEKAEEEMIEQAFQELLNDYLATKHRKRVEIITKAFNFANQAPRFPCEPRCFFVRRRSSLGVVRPASDI